MIGGHGIGGFMDFFTTAEEPQPTALVYDRAGAIAKQNALHGVLPPFAILDFVTGVAEVTARNFQRECWLLADRLKASGVLDELFAGYVTWFANHGALLYPSRDQVKDDPEALDALNAALVKFGFADLKHRILAAQQLTARAQAEELEKRTAFWDVAYESCRWLSGMAAVDACLEYVRNIGQSVQAIRLELDRAREIATPEEYAAMLALAGPVNDQLTRMRRFVAGSDEETGGMLGSPTLVLVVVAGVTLVILAAIWASVEHHRNLITGAANEILGRRQAELEASRQREYELIDGDPSLSPEEKNEAKRGAEENYREEVGKLPPPSAAPSGLGISMGSLAAIGIAAVAALVVLPMLSGRR